MNPASEKYDFAFLSAYIDAAVAYRIIVRETLESFVAEYGLEKVTSWFSVKTIASLLDAHDSCFLSHRQAAKFASNNRTASGTKIVERMYTQLSKDVALNELSRLLRIYGDREIANDVPFYIEHRFRLARAELNALFVQPQDTTSRSAVAAHG